LSHPWSGWLYESAIPRAQASHLLVLTEDDWNAQMSDSVVVPLYGEAVTPSKVAVPVDDGLTALCTRVQSVPHDFIGRAVRRCREEPWVRVRIGVRAYLDIDRRISKAPTLTPVAAREDWWPRQRAIRFAENPHIGPHDKLYAVISDDDWNSAPAARYAAAVRLTSRTKDRRLRWEVPVAGSWVVTGDLYSISYARFQQAPPRGDYPKQMTVDESAEVATRQRATLSLR